MRHGRSQRLDLAELHNPVNTVGTEAQFRAIIAQYFENKNLRDWCNDLGIMPPEDRAGRPYSIAGALARLRGAGKRRTAGPSAIVPRLTAWHPRRARNRARLSRCDRSSSLERESRPC